MDADATAVDNEEAEYQLLGVKWSGGDRATSIAWRAFI